MKNVIVNKTNIFSILVIGIFIIYYFTSKIDFLIPHTIIEMVGTTIAFTIFTIGWNTRQLSRNNFLLFLAIGYLVVGIFSILHTLSYEGTGLFTEYGHNLPTQFWTASSFIRSITLFIATVFIKKNKKINSKLLFFIFLLIASLINLSIFFDLFPDCYTENVGVTPFKMISSYLICVIFIISGYILWKKRNLFDKNIFNFIIYSVIFIILSELSFTFYSDTYGFFNLLGHYFMLISLLSIYYSLIYETLTKPFRKMFMYVNDYAEQLDQKNDELRIKDKAIESSYNGIVFINCRGVITYVNKTFLKLLSYQKSKELIGRTARSFFSDKNKYDEIEDELKLKGSWHGELLAIRRDNSYSNVYITVNYVYSEEGKPICIMASFIDITKRKKTEIELLKAKKNAEEASMAKSNFLANMSHEIRTPMNGILGFLHLLENTQLNQEQAEYTSNIKTSTETLLTVINDILDVSKIESGKMELDHQSFDLYKAIHKSIIPFTAKAEEKGIQLNHHLKNNVPQYVFGDEHKLRQVISNLVNNAVKFTDVGNISINVERLSTGMIQFTIEDTGVGMSKNTLSKIFQPFTQGDVSSTRRYGGTGLGLTICKSVIEMMGGSIQVYSEENKGTKFIFTVHLKEAECLDTNKKDDNKFTMNENNLSQLKILIVEDNEVNKDFFVALLKMKRIDCDVVENGKEAVHACLNQHYDIVFMDCQMPIMDGYEATRIIRKRETKHTIIIAMTADAMKGDLENCLNAGMDDYLSKPIEVKKVMTMIEKYIKT